MSVKGSGSEGSHCTGEFYPMGAWGGRGGGGRVMPCLPTLFWNLQGKLKLRTVRI